MRTLDAVCFDLDDTLFDYGQYVRAGFAAAAERVADETGEDVYDDFERAYFEEEVRDGTFDRVLDRRGVDVEVGPLVEAFHGRTGDLDPYPEARAVLDRLGSAYDLGLVTDGRNGRAKLDALGLADAFDAVVVAYDHGISKRDAEAFERAFDALGAAPERTVYVGDNPEADFPVANRLGVRTVRLRRGRYADRPADGDGRPDEEIDSLEELLSLVPADC